MGFQNTLEGLIDEKLGIAEDYILEQPAEDGDPSSIRTERDMADARGYYATLKEFRDAIPGCIQDWLHDNEHGTSRELKGYMEGFAHGLMAAAKDKALDYRILHTSRDPLWGWHILGRYQAAKTIYELVRDMDAVPVGRDI